MRWFTDPEIGAVAGNAKVGNRINMITRWQALEYIVAQNLERRALAALGTLTVIPGAVGAWRKSVLQEMGGFHSDTLAEDQGISPSASRPRAGACASIPPLVAWTGSTIDLRRSPRASVSAGRARHAAVPVEIQQSDIQSALWRAGTYFALPQVWLFQIALTALAPLADLLLIWQLISQWIAYSQHGAEFSNSDLITVGIYYIVFVIVDLHGGDVRLPDGKPGEDWRQPLFAQLPLQRFGYRQLMYYVVVRSISAAHPRCRGRLGQARSAPAPSRRRVRRKEGAIVVLPHGMP